MTTLSSQLLRHLYLLGEFNELNNLTANEKDQEVQALIKSFKRWLGQENKKIDLLRNHYGLQNIDDRQKEIKLDDSILNGKANEEAVSLLSQAKPTEQSRQNGLPVDENMRGHSIKARRPLNTVGKAQKSYTIDDQNFKLQNVSGKSMRCFFNAVGLSADIELGKLRSNKNNLTVRNMIANEIVSAAATPSQLSLEVKKAIQFSLYEKQREDLDNLEEQRSEMLLVQDSDSNQQDIQSLPIPLQNVGKNGDAILEELKERALSLEAFNAFLDSHIGSEDMMVALHDVKGENHENEYANCTSIDAIAYINNFGIKIYQQNGRKGLSLRHQFIPKGSTEVVYLYHEGVHFQSLVPNQIK